MSKTDILRLTEYLGHIVQATDRIQRYVSDMTESTFLLDEKTQDAVIRNFEIIGEASNNVRRHHPDFVGHAQRIQGVRRVFQGAPVGGGAHDQANQWIHAYRARAKFKVGSPQCRNHYAPAAARWHPFR